MTTTFDFFRWSREIGFDVKIKKLPYFCLEMLSMEFNSREYELIINFAANLKIGSRRSNTSV